MIELFVLFLTMVIQVIIPPIPAELIVLSASNKYGVLITTLFAGSGLFIGSIIVYFFGNYLSKFFNSKKTNIVREKFQKYGFLILLIRVLPYNPSDIISYVAGILKYNQKKYIIITFFVSYIRVVILSFLGSRVSNIFELISVFIILFLSGSLISYYLYKK